jgi:glycosyltransferase involved in cell wall biosynthesis
MKLSVVICAHNPRPGYLARVLDALAAQTLPKEEWELLLVDNGSWPKLSERWDLSWHPAGRHIVESELGVAVARRRGMRMAIADLIVFVDDDNVLDASYLSETLRIANDWPELGVWGSGNIAPEFELAPAHHLSRLVPNLALRSASRACWGNVLPSTDITPWGAGLCLRRDVATAYLRHCETSSIQLVSRRGNETLMSGEDVEMAHVACEHGLGAGVFPSLRLTHLIPPSRVTEDYLLKIFEGTLASNYLLSFKWKGLYPPSFGARTCLAVLKNVLFSRGLDRRMYFANLRAVSRARRIIAAARVEPLETAAGPPAEALSAGQ